ncbi:MAG: IS200/IS605 family transposase [Pyrinomonadaceae bacterium]|nr:IS200/IS605 family transposase [Pyrinomonadaceae bacterium]
MANTYSSLFYHLVFSTKNRKKFITQDIENRVWAYIGGIARMHGITAVQVGGIEDHIHALILSPPKIAPSRIAQYIKGDSSKWIHVEFPKLRAFAWQDGYSVFSASKSSVPSIVAYIKNQRVHHQGNDFEKEYIDLLDRHEIDVVDKKYILG